MYAKWKDVGQEIQLLREDRGLTQEAVSEAVDYSISSYQRLEYGRLRPPREKLVLILIEGVLIDDPSKASSILEAYNYVGLTLVECRQFGLVADRELTFINDSSGNSNNAFMANKTTMQDVGSAGCDASPERVSWVPDHDGSAGIVIRSARNQFIPLAQLKIEVETRVLPQVYSLPVGSTIIVKDHLTDGGVKKNWLVRIVNPRGRIIAGMWFGGDPEKEWAFDGLIRVGPHRIQDAKPHRVWEIYQRFSDGSYRKISGVLGPATYSIPST